MRRKEIPNPIWIKFAGVIAISEVIMYENFGDDRLRVFLGWRGLNLKADPRRPKEPCTRYTMYYYNYYNHLTASFPGQPG